MEFVRGNLRFILLGTGLLIVILAIYFLNRNPEQSQAEDAALPSPSLEVKGAPPTDTASPTAGESPAAIEEKPIAKEIDYQIITLLPKDAIPAIDAPRFYSAEEADAEYEALEMVLGVSINGESRAYSTPLLDRHEIVNDVVGGRKIAVTW